MYNVSMLIYGALVLLYAILLAASTRPTGEDFNRDGVHRSDHRKRH